MLIDSHCHLQFKGYDADRKEVLKRCSVKGMIINVVGTQKDTSKKAVELAEANKDIYATIGLHPVHLHATQVDEEEASFLSREEDFDEAFYDELAKSEKVIAVGECGLELFHFPEGTDKNKILEKQKIIFIQQLRFAWNKKLPVVVHCRDAYEEIVEVLKLEIGNCPAAKTGSRCGVEKLEIQPGVIHCYSSNWQNAQKFLDMGFYLGFTGVITFPARKTNPQPTLDLLEVVEKCPLDRILVETDAPYLAPQVYRGQRCEPWMVEEVVKEIAKIKQKSVEEITKTIIENTLRLFSKLKIN